MDVMTIPSRRASARDCAAGAAVAVLGMSNVATNRWLPPAAYVPWNLTVSAGLIVLARRSGCCAAELGADPRRLRGSLHAGAVGAGVVAAGYAFLLCTPARNVLRDDRVTSLRTTTALGQLLLRIPLGTVLAEEVAFRGVLPALLASPRRPAWLPGTIASLLFGLWHVLPSRELFRANVGFGGAAATAPGGAVPLAVGATTLAGWVLHSLRRRAGHLAAPLVVHLATNVLGFLGARLTGRQHSGM
jgi:membrane protease YdiL (CAAX protease family)